MITCRSASRHRRLEKARKVDACGLGGKDVLSVSRRSVVDQNRRRGTLHKRSSCMLMQMFFAPS
eukprot:52511-Pyramimonas_sp.AAC.1